MTPEEAGRAGIDLEPITLDEFRCEVLSLSLSLFGQLKAVTLRAVDAGHDPNVLVSIFESEFMRAKEIADATR